MIQRARVQPNATWLRSPRDVNDAIQEPAAKSAPNEVGQQAEVCNLGLARHAPIELCVTRADAIQAQDVKFNIGMADDRSQCAVAQALAIDPCPVPSDL